MSEALEQAAPEGHDEPQTQSESAETKALRMGWKPQEEFNGDKSKWVDAETFVKRGEEFLPFVQANNKALEAKNRELDKELKKLKRTLEEFSDHHTKTEKRIYERTVRELQSRQDAAVEAGDVSEVRTITKELAELQAEVTAKPAPTHPNGWSPDFADAFDEFTGENAWHGKDKAMTVLFNQEHDDLLAENPGWSHERRFREALKRVKEEMPHKFENPNRAKPAPVGDGATPGARRSNGRSYADLPPEAKAACDKFVRNIPGFTREQYTKDFFGS